MKAWETINGKKIEPLAADDGMFKHHIAMPPCQAHGVISETYQLLNQSGLAVANCFIQGGEYEFSFSEKEARNVLNRLFFDSWLAQLGAAWRERDSFLNKNA